MADVAVKIVGKDGLSGTLDAINKKIGGMSAPFDRAQKSLAKFGDVSGLGRVGKAFGDVAYGARNAFGKISEIVAPLGAITGAASLAGMYRMISAWSEWGSQLGFAAQNMNVAASTLSGFQGAARLAGSSTGSLTSGLQTLGQTMFDAIGGRAPEAIVMFNTLGISFRDATGHARNVADVLPQVADRIAAIHDPFVQARVATELFGAAGADLLPFLRRGAIGMAEYQATAARYNPVTRQSIEAANQFRIAQTRLSLSVDGLGNRISTSLSPVLVPLLTQLADWIAISPDVQSGIDGMATGVRELGNWLRGVDWKGVGGELETWGRRAEWIAKGFGGFKDILEGVLVIMGLSFATKVILPFAKLGSTIISATAALRGFAVAETAAEAAGAGGGLASKLGKVGGAAVAEGATVAEGGALGIGGGLAIGAVVTATTAYLTAHGLSWAFGAGWDDPGAKGPTANMGGRGHDWRVPIKTSSGPIRGLQPVPYTPGSILSDVGVTRNQYDAFKGAVAGIERARYDQMGGSSNRFAGRYQMGAQEIRETAYSLGEQAPTQQQFLANPAQQERYFEAYTDAHARQLMRSSKAYQDANPEQRLAFLGYAHNQGAGGAASWLSGGAIGHDAFGTSGTAYSKAVMRAELGVPADAILGPAPSLQAPTTGAEIANQFAAAIANGPAMQAPAAAAGTTAGNDGTVTVRLQHAIPPPSGFKATVASSSGSLAGAQIAQANTTAALP